MTVETFRYHTPWSVIQIANYNGPDYYAVVTPLGKRVACFASEADANLVAVAPKLLLSLQEVLEEYLSEYLEEDGIYEAEHVKNAHAVIDAAGGRAEQ